MCRLEPPGLALLERAEGCRISRILREGGDEPLMPRFVLPPGHAPISIPRAGVPLVMINDAVGQLLHALALLRPQPCATGLRTQQICTDQPFCGMPLCFTQSASMPPDATRQGPARWLPNSPPAHGGVHNVLHTGVNPLECAIVSGQGLQQRLGWRVVRQQRTRHLLR